MFRRLLKLLVLALVSLAGLAGLYFGAAYVLSRWPVNDEFQDDPNGILVALSSNGIHANLHMPIRALDVDWTEIFPPTDFPAHPLKPDTIAFGWGSREFYLNVPTWDDLELQYALKALTGIGGTALHVSYWEPWPPGENYVEFRITPEAYRSLVADVKATILPDAAGLPQRIAGYSYLGNDGFYEARGSYHMFVTCNEWVRGALQDAGVRTGVWSPFPDALLDHVRQQ